MKIPKPPAPTFPPTNTAATDAERIAALERRVAELEHFADYAGNRVEKLMIDRACLALSTASRDYWKDRRIVFVGRDIFGDNVKYAYLDFLKRSRDENVDLWFLPHNARQEEQARSLGGNVFPADPEAWSRDLTLKALMTGVAVFGDHFDSQTHPNALAMSLLAGATRVQLWHGIPIKKIALEYVSELSYYYIWQRAKRLSTATIDDVFVGETPETEQEWRRRFAFDRYEPCGYARNDVFFRNLTSEDYVNVDMTTLEKVRATRSSGGKVYLYCPTFRERSRFRTWIFDVGIERVAAHLKARGDRLVFNVHPYEQQMAAEFARRTPHIDVTTPGCDIYPLANETDVLITDYSSLTFDYLFMGKPVLFFQPDDYIDTRSLGGVAADLEALSPPVASIDALVDALATGLESRNCPITTRRLLARHQRYRDGLSSRRTGDMILRELDARLRNQRGAVRAIEGIAEST